MRILISSQTYAPAANGQSVFTTRLAQGLARRGHQVVVALPNRGEKGNPTASSGVAIELFHSIHLLRLNEAYFTPFPYFSVVQLFDRIKPDILHIQDHYPMSRWIHFEASRRKLPIVATNHFIPENIVHYLAPFGWGNRLIKTFLWWSMSSLYNRVDLVTTPTQTAAEILRSNGLKTPIEAVSCGVDLNEFQPDPLFNQAQCRSRFGLPKTKPVFLYVGRVDEEKGLSSLLRAVANVKEPIKLVIAGKGHYLDSLKELAGRLSILDTVVFTGYVTEARLKDYLQATDVFIMPSPSELQSISTLEAMALGKPIIAADARALPELVEPGVNGFLFEPKSVTSLAETLRRCLDDRGEWKNMGQASLEKVRQHDLVRTIDQYLKIYKQLSRSHSETIEDQQSEALRRSTEKGIGP